jgi:hypothetical protein
VWKQFSFRYCPHEASNNGDDEFGWCAKFSDPAVSERKRVGTERCQEKWPQFSVRQRDQVKASAALAEARRRRSSRVR